MRSNCPWNRRRRAEFVPGIDVLAEPDRDLVLIPG